LVAAAAAAATSTGGGASFEIKRTYKHTDTQTMEAERGYSEE
jgi:hypothetical protein